MKFTTKKQESFFSEDHVSWS